MDHWCSYSNVRYYAVVCLSCKGKDKQGVDRLDPVPEMCPALVQLSGRCVVASAQ